MLTKFGITEAAKAGVFAKTKEQKETVFGVLAMMGVPVVIKEQVAKLTAKLTKKINKNADKVEVLEGKIEDIDAKIQDQETEKDGVEITAQEWDFYNMR